MKRVACSVIFVANIRRLQILSCHLWVVVSVFYRDIPNMIFASEESNHIHQTSTKALGMCFEFTVKLIQEECLV